MERKNYTATSMVSDEDFAKNSTNLLIESKDARLIQTSKEELLKIERLLGAPEGSFENEVMYFEDTVCKCGNKVGWYDHTLSGLVDVGHKKDFLLSVMLGDKKFLSDPHPVRCSSCATVIDRGVVYPAGPCYASRVYACCMAEK